MLEGTADTRQIDYLEDWSLLDNACIVADMNIIIDTCLACAAKPDHFKTSGYGLVCTCVSISVVYVNSCIINLVLSSICILVLMIRVEL